MTSDEQAQETPPRSRPRRGSRGGSERGGGLGASAFRVSPFARLARSHSAGTGGDALVAIALADSLFFSIDPNDARWRVALYLMLTVAPFGVVAPWLGPAMDRLKGGTRYMLVASAVGRSVLAIGMAIYIDTLWLFPLAFSMLVLGKSHHIAKSALVPTTVRDEAGLVHANSRLSIISSLSAAVAGIPGVLLLTLGGARWSLGLASVLFMVAAVLATKVPSVTVADSPAGAEEKAEMRGAGIVLAASAMGYVRGVVGFLTMLLAFELRGGVDPGPVGTGVELGHGVREALGGVRLDLSSGGAPTWHFGLVLVSIGVGGLTGAFSSPRLRNLFPEERILAGGLAGISVCGVLATLAGGLPGAMGLAFAVSVAGQAGKQSFDAIVQRDAKEANLGRLFARFESRFQLIWVFGALIPVLLPIPARLGFLLLAVTAGFAAVSYWLGRDPSPKAEGIKNLTRGIVARRATGSVAKRPAASEDEADSGADPRRGPSATDVYSIPPGPPPTEPPPIAAPTKSPAGD